jgi:hypothetical protein
LFERFKLFLKGWDILFHIGNIVVEVDFKLLRSCLETIRGYDLHCVVRVLQLDVVASSLEDKYLWSKLQPLACQGKELGGVRVIVLGRVGHGIEIGVTKW